jgi:tyrosine-protein phosphatase YwqE
VIVDTEVAITDMTQDGIILGAIDNENDIRYYLIGFNNEHFYVKNDSGSSNLSL